MGKRVTVDELVSAWHSVTKLHYDRYSMPGEEKQRFITLGEGPDRHVVPLGADGKLHGNPPEHVRAKIEAGTRDPEKKAAWAAKANTGTKRPVDMNRREWEAHHAPLRDAYENARSGVDQAERNLLDAAPKNADKLGRESRLQAAREKRGNKPLVDAHAHAQQSFENALDTYRPYMGSHREWLLDRLKAGEHVPDHHDAQYPMLGVARKLAEEAKVRQDGSRKLRAQPLTEENLPAVWNDVKDEITRANHYDMSPRRAGEIAAARVRNEIERRAMPLYERKYGSSEDAPAESHTYGLRNRPVSLGTVPKGFTETGSHPEFRHGTVTYREPLLEKDQHAYELTKLPNAHDREDFVRKTAKELSPHKEGYLEDYAEDPQYTEQAVGQRIHGSGLHLPDREGVTRDVIDALREDRTEPVERGRGGKFTPDEQRFMDFADSTLSGTALERMSGSRSIYSDRHDEPEAARPLDAPHLPDASMNSAIRDAEEARKRELHASRVGKPIPDAAWHLEREDVGDDLPHGHGVIHERGASGGAPYHYARGVLQLPNGEHYSDTSGRDYSRQGGPDEHKLLEVALEGYAHERGKNLHWDAPERQKAHADIDAVGASLKPWRDRTKAMETRQTVDQDYRHRLKSREEADADQGWRGTKEDYVKANSGKVTPKQLFRGGRSAGYEDPDEAATRRHRELVQLAHHGGHDVPDHALDADETYHVPEHAIPWGERDTKENPELTAQAKSIGAKARAVEEAKHAANRERVAAFHGALDAAAKATPERDAAFRPMRAPPNNKGGPSALDADEVSGKTLGSGAFVWHKDIDNPKAWGVSHAPSGMSAGGGFKTATAAKRAARVLEEAVQHVPHLTKHADGNIDALFSAANAMHGAPVKHSTGDIEPSAPEDIQHEGVRASLESLARQHGYKPESFANTPSPLPETPAAPAPNWNMQEINRARVAGRNVPDEAYAAHGGREAFAPLHQATGAIEKMREVASRKESDEDAHRRTVEAERRKRSDHESNQMRVSQPD